MREIIIKVTVDEGGGTFLIYEGDEKYIECEEIGGGVCASGWEMALDEACKDAKDIITRAYLRGADCPKSPIAP